MKRARFSEEQIIGILRENEAGAKAGELARKHGVSEGTIYAWKAKFGGMSVSDAQRLRTLEEENVSSVAQFSPKVGFENSLVGIACQGSAGASPGRTLSRDRRTLPLGGGGADGPTWRTDDDLGIASTGAVGHRNRAADGRDPKTVRK